MQCNQVYWVFMSLNFFRFQVITIKLIIMKIWLDKRKCTCVNSLSCIWQQYFHGSDILLNLTGMFLFCPFEECLWHTDSPSKWHLKIVITNFICRFSVAKENPCLFSQLYVWPIIGFKFWNAICTFMMDIHQCKQ